MLAERCPNCQVVYALGDLKCAKCKTPRPEVVVITPNDIAHLLDAALHEIRKIRSVLEASVALRNEPQKLAGS